VKVLPLEECPSSITQPHQEKSPVGRYQAPGLRDQVSGVGFLGQDYRRVAVGFDERLQGKWAIAPLVFRGNKARMSMKTKEDDKQSEAGADVAFECLRCAEGAGLSGCGVSPDLSLRDIADPRRQGSAPAVDLETGGTKRECL